MSQTLFWNNKNKCSFLLCFSFLFLPSLTTHLHILTTHSVYQQLFPAMGQVRVQRLILRELPLLPSWVLLNSRLLTLT